MTKKSDVIYGCKLLTSDHGSDFHIELQGPLLHGSHLVGTGTKFLLVQYLSSISIWSGERMHATSLTFCPSPQVEEHCQSTSYYYNKPTLKRSMKGTEELLIYFVSNDSEVLIDLADVRNKENNVNA